MPLPDRSAVRPRVAARRRAHNAVHDHPPSPPRSGQALDLHAALLDHVIAGGGVQSLATRAAEHLGVPVSVASPSPSPPSTIEPRDRWPVRSGASHVADLVAPAGALDAATVRVLELSVLAAMATEVALGERGARALAVLRDPATDRATSARLHAELGLPAPAVVVAWSPSPDDDHAPEGVAPLGPGVGMLSGPEALDHATALAEAHGRPMGVSPLVVRGEDLAGAVRIAGLVLAQAVREGRPAHRDVANARDRLVLWTAVDDPQALRQLRDRHVAPLRAADAANGTRLYATARTLVRHDGAVLATAHALGCHRHTVGDRIRRIEQLAGLDLRTLDGRDTFALALRAGRLLAVLPG